MEHSKYTIELANKLIKLHVDSGLSEEQATIAERITAKCVVNAGTVPEIEKMYQQVFNYLGFYIKSNKNTK